MTAALAVEVATPRVAPVEANHLVEYKDLVPVAAVAVVEEDPVQVDKMSS